MSDVAFLDLPATRARLARFTVEQYHQLGEYSTTGQRTELIRGYVFDKMSKSPLDSSIGTRLYDLLHPQLSANWWLRKEEPLTLADSEPESDLSIVRGSDADYRTSHPHTAALVIEIAITTQAEDRALAALYAEAGATVAPPLYPSLHPGIPPQMPLLLSIARDGQTQVFKLDQDRRKFERAEGDPAPQPPPHPCRKLHADLVTCDLRIP